MKKPDGCIGCPFFDDGEGFVPDELRPDAKLAMIAQNPGETEEGLGKPLIGRTGQLVMNDMSKYGLKREDASFLNIIKCRWRKPGDKVKCNILPENGETHAAASQCIRKYLIPNLASIHPNLTVLLGDLALYYGAGWTEVGSWRGSVFIATGGECKGRKVLPMIHPAALWRDLSWRTAYKLDFTRLAREMKSPTPCIVYADNFRLGVSAAEFIETLDSLSKQKKMVALDIETSRNKPIEAKLDTIGIAWSKTDAMNYLYGLDPDMDKLVLNALSEFRGEFITATPFDYIVLQKLGVKFVWDLCHDLTLFHSRFDIELPHGVDFVCSMLTNRPYWKWMNASEPLLYNALDCVGEWEAFDALKTHCQRNDFLVWKIYDEDRRCLPVEVALHLNGFPTEKKLIDEERVWYEERRDVLEAELLEAFKPKEELVEPPRCEIHKRYSGKSPLKIRKKESELCASCVKLAEFYKASLPLKLRSRQKLMGVLKKDGMVMFKDHTTHKDSLAKGKVADLYKKYGDPRLLKLLEFWEMDTVTSRYFKEAWITKATGRIHPTYSMHSAMHRWHCSKPNMQQMRKPEKQVIEIPDEEVKGEEGL